jgi:hypothetical protein
MQNTIIRKFHFAMRIFATPTHSMLYGLNMAITKPRTKLVNFRLSEEEFQEMKTASAQFGARSLSDFARAAVLKSSAGETESDGLLRVKLTDLDQKVSEIESNMRQIKDYLTSAATA